MDWKKILLKAIGKFHDVLLKTQPSVVDLEGSIKELVNETRFVGMVYKFCVQAVMPAMSTVHEHIFSDRASQSFKHLQNSQQCRTLCLNDCFSILDHTSTT